MTKLTRFARKILGFSPVLALGLALSPGFCAAAGEAPPPPFVNTEAPAPPMVDPGAAVQTQAVDPNAFDTEDAKQSGVAAPSISDDQQIKNAMEMAYQLYHAEDYDACAKATAAIVDRYPKKGLYWVRYLEALSMEHQDQYLPAIEQYQKVREEAARSTYANAAVFRIGLCQLKSGQYEEAIYTLRDIIENNPRSEYRLQAYIHLGNLYRRTRDWRAAQRIYKDIIKIYPNTGWAWTSTLYLAETHSHQGRNDTAIRVYDGLVRNDQAPRTMRAQAQLRIGDLYIADEKWLEALETYREALRDYHDVPGVSITCEQKIEVATAGRRYGRVPYRQVKRGVRLTEAPADEDYRLKQEQEKVPYQ
jgi:tetratricopeptide (TPR) repeat protein